LALDQIIACVINRFPSNRKKQQRRIFKLRRVYQKFWNKKSFCDGTEALKENAVDFPCDVHGTLWTLPFDMLMTGVEDIRGRLGVAYRALGCSLLLSLISLFHSSFLSFTHVSRSLFLSLCVCTEMPDHQLSRTSGIKRAKKPVYLAGLQDRRSRNIDISRERHAIVKKKNVYNIRVYM